MFKKLLDLRGEKAAAVRLRAPDILNGDRYLPKGFVLSERRAPRQSIPTQALENLFHMHDHVRMCAFDRCGQQASVLGGLQAAPDRQRGPERRPPPDTHVLLGDAGTPLRSGRL